MKHLDGFKNFPINEESESLSARLEDFYNGVEDILVKSNPPKMTMDIEINSISDITKIIRNLPGDIYKWCVSVYEENKEFIEKLAQKVLKNKQNEEICILTLICIGLIAYSLYNVWKFEKAKRVAKRSGQEFSGTLVWRNPKLWKGKSKTNAPTKTTSMSQSEIKREIDKALDKKDYKKAKELSGYLK